jgi:hypothetical protein
LNCLVRKWTAISMMTARPMFQWTKIASIFSDHFLYFPIELQEDSSVPYIISYYWFEWFLQQTFTEKQDEAQDCKVVLLNPTLSADYSLESIPRRQLLLLQKPANQVCLYDSK